MKLNLCLTCMGIDLSLAKAKWVVFVPASIQQDTPSLTENNRFIEISVLRWKACDFVCD